MATRRNSTTAEATPRSRRVAEEEVEATPRSRREGRSEPRSSAGWGAYEKVRDNLKSDYKNEWKIPANETLIRFLEEGPFSTYEEHWVDREGKKSFTCPGDDCPLCDANNYPKAYALFNILVFEDLDNPTVEVLKASGVSRGLIKQIYAYSQNSATSPINREDMYWVAYKTGEKLDTRYHLERERASHLKEDFNIEPLTAAQLKPFLAEMITDEKDFLYFDSMEKLREAAKDIKSLDE